jgi:organic radical activating enzyme
MIQTDQTTMPSGIDPGSTVDVQRLFRMPWTMSDNAMSWLEPTRKCNITCDACFAINDPESQKPLWQIESELNTSLKLRRCDAVLIGGGEPLTHPHIVDIARMVKNRNVKAQIATNGVDLDTELLHELHKNGLYGITFHVDSHQSRPGWQGKTEKELNDLRQQFADMVRKEGKLVCGFNTTIFPDTVRFVPDIVEWTSRNIRDVAVMTLIAARMLSPETPFDFYSGGRKVDLSEMGFYSTHHYESLTTLDIYSEVRKALPDYRFCAYLGGTTLPNSLKWAIAVRIGSAKHSYGNLGPKSMEILQNVYHALNGVYLAYAKPSLSRKGKLLFLLGLFDPELRKTAKNYFHAVLKHPSRFVDKLSVQTISILQPVDILPSGEQDHCDGCPNGTVWRNRLVPACQLDNYVRFGGPVRMVPKSQSVNPSNP